MKLNVFAAAVTAFSIRGASAMILIQDGFDYPDMAALTSQGGWEFTCQSTDYNGVNPPGNNMSGPCTMDLVSNPVHGGSKSLRFTYANGTTQYTNGAYNGGGLSTNIGRYFGPVDEFYERYYVRFEAIDPNQPTGWADAIQSMGAKQHYFNPGGADPGGAFGISYFFNKYWSADNQFRDKMGLQIGFNDGKGGAVQCPDGHYDVNCDEIQNIQPYFTMPYNQWVCVETHYRMNTIGQRDGVIELWQNSQLVLQETNAQMRTDPSSAYRLIRLYRQDAVNQYRYEDDYVMATTKIGCGGPIDTNSPAAPGGVIVR